MIDCYPASGRKCVSQRIKGVPVVKSTAHEKLAHLKSSSCIEVSYCSLRVCTLGAGFSSVRRRNSFKLLQCLRDTGRIFKLEL
jgi:hypothetical protein